MGNVRQMIDVSDSELRAALYASLAVDRWVDEVAAAAPFEDAARLLEAANDAASPLSPAEIEEAVAHHPRIGERPVGEGRAQEFSRAEQAGLGDEDSDLDEELAAGNRAYEERFGRVFIIRAAGRTKREILAELRERLELPNSTELEIVGDQLRQIALLRLEKQFAPELP